MNSQQVADSMLSGQITRWVTGSICACCLLVHVARSHADSVVIPAEYSSREGSAVFGSNVTPGITPRFQFLYYSFEFPPEPIEITGFRLRPKSSTGDVTMETRGLQVSLSTFNEMSLGASYRSNIDNSTRVANLVIDGDYVAKTTRPEPPVSLRDFDYEYTWEATPVRYDPTEGANLLLDFSVTGGAYGAPSWDAANVGNFSYEGELLHRANVNGGLNSRFPITEFLYRPVRSQYPPGDLDQDGVLSGADLDLLAIQIRATSQETRLDLNRDTVVDVADYTYWVKQLRKSWLGDANLDGEFNSSDLIDALAAGTYESDMDAGWSSGDFDGDGRFDSGDLIVALADGGYEQVPRASTAAVPEPSSLALLLFGLVSLTRSVVRQARPAVAHHAIPSSIPAT